MSTPGVATTATPSRRLAFGGNEAVVRLLIDRGADVNTQGGVHRNALQAAALKGDEAVVRLLVDRGADVNTQGGYYGNALQEAASKGNEAVVRLLVDRGANVNIQGGYEPWERSPGGDMYGW
jgi:ankyrin repeat protein